MPPQATEIKAAQALTKALDSLSWNNALFAHFLTHTNIKIQRRVFEMFLECIFIWANWYDREDWNTDEGMNLYAEAKRMKDFLESYGYKRKGDF